MRQCFHSGADVGGSARAYEHFVGQMAVRARVSAFVPDYRLGPEHPLPVVLRASLSMRHSTPDDPRRGFKNCGVGSAGANFAGCAFDQLPAVPCATDQVCSKAYSQPAQGRRGQAVRRSSSVCTSTGGARRRQAPSKDRPVKDRP